MDSIELVASPKTLNYFFASLLYIPACLMVYRLLFPRLTADAKALALFTLVAQIAVLVVSLEAQPNSAVEEWLWDIDKEWNIPSAVASTLGWADRVRRLVCLVGFTGYSQVAAALAARDWAGFPDSRAGRVSRYEALKSGLAAVLRRGRNCLGMRDDCCRPAIGAAAKTVVPMLILWLGAYGGRRLSDRRNAA